MWLEKRSVAGFTTTTTAATTTTTTTTTNTTTTTRPLLLLLLLFLIFLPPPPPPPFQESPSNEGGVGEGAPIAWNTGIAEVALPIQYKLKNIEQTEKARKVFEVEQQHRRGMGRSDDVGEEVVVVVVVVVVVAVLVVISSSSSSSGSTISVCAC